MSYTHCLMPTLSLFKGGSQGALCLCTAKVTQITPYAATSFELFSIYQTWSFRVVFKVDVDN